MNIISFNGGLGNQLFQYSFGLALKYEYGYEVKFCKKFINKSQLSIEDIFDIKIFEPLEEDYIKILGKLFVNDQIRNTSVRILKKFGVNNFHNFRLEDYKNSFLSLPNLDNKFFFGYWQNIKYFFFHLKQIKKNLKFKVENQIFNEFFKLKNDYSNIVCLHIRLGDYNTKKNLRVFSKIPMNYYLDSIKIFERIYKNPVFILFTNEFEKVNDSIKKKLNVIPSSNLNFGEMNDFYLMSLCDSFIFSNSTFSIWAAYLSQKKDINFTKPDRWYISNDIEMANYYFPSHWNCLN